MPIFIYKGKGGLFSFSTCVGKVTYDHQFFDAMPNSISIRYGTGLFGDLAATGKRNGHSYDITVINRGMLGLKERSFSSYSLGLSKTFINNGLSHLGYCQDGKIYSNRNNIIGTYSCISNDLNEDVIALLASVGAGLLLDSELSIDNKFM